MGLCLRRSITPGGLYPQAPGRCISKASIALPSARREPTEHSFPSCGFRDNDGRHALFLHGFVVRRDISLENLVPFVELFVELLAEHVEDVIGSLSGCSLGR